MTGSARLKAGLAKRVNFSQVPQDARATLGKTRAGLHHAEWVARKKPYTERPVKQAELPGSIYRVGAASETFLIVPAGSGEGDFARSCAVIWKGEDYLKARRAIIGAVKEEPGQILLPSQNADGFGYTFQESGDFMISIVTYKGWTALVGAPKLTTKPKAVR